MGVGDGRSEMRPNNLLRLGISLNKGGSQLPVATGPTSPSLGVFRNGNKDVHPASKTPPVAHSKMHPGA